MVTTKTPETTNKADEAQPTSPILRPEELREVTTWDDAEKYLIDVFGDVRDASEDIGDGYTLLPDKTDKDLLVGVPLMVMGFTFSPGDFGAEFCTMRVMTKTPITINGEQTNRIIVNDGGTGLAQQLRQWSNDHDGRMGGLKAMRGLRKSEYDNEFGHGTTHYLNV